jgi:addiction module RelE/StbE family toxin
MRVKWLRKALANLDHAAGYIAKDNTSAARAMVMVAETFRLADLLADNPNLGRAGRVPGTRELIMPRHPYIIPYRIRGGCVEVLRFFHTARQWPESL